MSDVAITVADTGVYSGTKTRTVLVGEAVTHGQAGYINTTNNDYRLAKANGTEEEASVAGFFMSKAASGGYALFVEDGYDINIGNSSLASDYYVLSATPGAICPKADLTAGQRLTYVGFGKSTTKFSIDINATGLTV